MKRRTVNGAQLRALREQADVRMADVAAAAGCSCRHLQMIETTPRQPSGELLLHILEELSRHLGRTVSLDEVSTAKDTAKDTVEAAA